MIVYNITIKIDPQIEKDWIEWQKNENIPEIMATGLFSEYKFYRLLEQDDTEGITYVMQYFTSSLENYKRYTEEYALKMQKKTFEKWKHQFIAFRTIMKIVN
ncbi:MAG TPA: DUF4286 family protein [Chitinophagaceae bacterium]|jgi:hypothetical protein